MNRDSSAGCGMPIDGSPPSESWLFAQAILGKPISRIVSPQTKALAERRELERLVRFSSSHAEALCRLRTAEAEARRDREILEWAAQISTEAEDKLRALQHKEAEEGEAWRRAEQRAEQLLEGNWDPSQHPRAPKGQADGGQWVTTGGSAGANAKSPSFSSDAVAAPLSRPSGVRSAVPLMLSANSQADANHNALTSPFDLPGDGAKGAGQNPFRLVSASSKDHAIAQAAAKGDLTMLKDLINSGGLSAGEQKAAQAAINRLMDTAQKIISKELKGSVMRQFPRDMLNMKLKDIMDLAKGSGPLADKAKTALKLLKDNRFKK